MIVLLAMILTFCVLGDVLFAGFVNGWRVAPQLAPLFLMYLVLRRPFSDVVYGLTIYTVLAHPLTGTSAVTYFFCHLAILGAVAFLRRGVYVEAYLTHALWSGFGVFILHMMLVKVSGVSWGAWLDSAVGAGLNALSALVFAIPVFLLCDGIFERRHFRRRRSYSPQLEWWQASELRHRPEAYT